jgi:serine phosphatase RsbU (regulator of sigma subunit)
MRSSFANSIMLLIAAVGIIMGLLVATTAWRYARAAHIAHCENQLARAADATAAGINPEQLLSLRDPTLSPAGSQRARDALTRLAAGGPDSGVELAFILAPALDSEDLSLTATAGLRAQPIADARKLLRSPKDWIIPRSLLREVGSRKVYSSDPGGRDLYTAASAITDDTGSRIAWLGVQADRAALASAFPSLSSTLLLSTLPLTAASLLAGYGLSRLATRRLRSIRTGAERLAQGDFRSRIPEHGTDELAAVARAVNSTATILYSLNLAKQVQQQLLPASTPSIPGLDIAAVCVYSDQTGGDYYDFLPLGENGRDGWAVLIADVTGHGVPAALLMATARSILRAQPLQATSLAEFLTRINSELCKQIPEGRFMTMYVLVIEPDGRTLRWASAGHDPAIVFDIGRNSFTELEGHDLPLGISPDASFTADIGSVASDGQIIVLGTDGIWECQNAESRMFGKEGLRRVLRKHANEPAAEISRQLLAALEKHRGPTPQSDDVTFVVMKLGTHDLLLERPAPGYVP